MAEFCMVIMNQAIVEYGLENLQTCNGAKI